MDQVTSLTARRLAAAVVVGLFSLASAVADEDATAVDRLVPTSVSSDIDVAFAHLAAFQDIADRHNDNRSAGEAGDAESRDYVEETLRALGYRVDRQAVAFRRFVVTTPTELRQNAPVEQRLERRDDYDLMTFSGSGSADNVLVSPVDLSLDDPASSTSGCEMEDFDGFVAGRIALAQRGGCSFAAKTANALEAGAVAIVIFNQGDTPRRQGRLLGSLGGLTGDGRTGVGLLPAFAVDAEQGAAWAALPELRLSFSVEAEVRSVETENVFAESDGGDPDRVVMAGAHLDSVEAGPGQNDNGSGSAALLAIAKALADDGATSRARYRFAWWGAEEVGLVGSEHYVATLGDAERRRIAVYLNFDMLASVNGGNFVMDGDGSEGAPGRRRPQTIAARDMAREVEAAYATYFRSHEIPYRVESMAFASDYAPFFSADIPIGGVYAGAGTVVDAEEAETFGGTVGVQRDPCYHEACDTLDNVDLDRLEVLMQASEFVIRRMGERASGGAPIENAAPSEDR